MSENRFGFIRPDAPNTVAPSAADIDRVGDKAGFEAREPEQRRYRRSGKAEATVPLSIRPPVKVANRFIAFCEKERLSYWQGLEKLMDMAGTE